ncbi:MAG: HD-GYP domain-containing protein [Candidatus Xenobia bacterium]
MDQIGLRTGGTSATGRQGQTTPQDGVAEPVTPQPEAPQPTISKATALLSLQERLAQKLEDLVRNLAPEDEPGGPQPQAEATPNFARMQSATQQEEVLSEAPPQSAPEPRSSTTRFAAPQQYGAEAAPQGEPHQTGDWMGTLSRMPMSPEEGTEPGPSRLATARTSTPEPPPAQPQAEPEPAAPAARPEMAQPQTSPPSRPQPPAVLAQMLADVLRSVAPEAMGSSTTQKLENPQPRSAVPEEGEDAPQGQLPRPPAARAFSPRGQSREEGEVTQRLRQWQQPPQETESTQRLALPQQETGKLTPDDSRSPEALPPQPEEPAFDPQPEPGQAQTALPQAELPQPQPAPQGELPQPQAPPQGPQAPPQGPQAPPQPGFASRFAALQPEPQGELAQPQAAPQGELAQPQTAPQGELPQPQAGPQGELAQPQTGPQGELAQPQAAPQGQQASPQASSPQQPGQGPRPDSAPPGEPPVPHPGLASPQAARPQPEAATAQPQGAFSQGRQPAQPGFVSSHAEPAPQGEQARPQAEATQTPAPPPQGSLPKPPGATAEAPTRSPQAEQGSQPPRPQPARPSVPQPGMTQSDYEEAPTQLAKPQPPTLPPSPDGRRFAQLLQPETPAPTPEPAPLQKAQQQVPPQDAPPPGRAPAAPPPPDAPPPPPELAQPVARKLERRDEQDVNAHDDTREEQDAVARQMPTLASPPPPRTTSSSLPTPNKTQLKESAQGVITEIDERERGGNSGGGNSGDQESGSGDRPSPGPNSPQAQASTPSGRPGNALPTAAQTTTAGAPKTQAEVEEMVMRRLAPTVQTRPALAADGTVTSVMETILTRSYRNEENRKRDAAKFLLLILKAHGSYTYDHCTRLVDLAIDLAKETGYEDDRVYKEVEYGLTFKDVGEASFFLTRQSPRQREALSAYLSGLNLAQGALLHDVGKIKVPPEILYKPGMLSPEEARIMQQHPVWGAEILSTIPPLHHAIPATRHHHERWDGRGYPDRLKGDQIPPSARIVAVVDTFDAMVADRPYRKGLSLEQARAEIERGAGRQFDPDIAKAFVRRVDKIWSPDEQY